MYFTVRRNSHLPLSACKRKPSALKHPPVPAPMQRLPHIEALPLDLLQRLPTHCDQPSSSGSIPLQFEYLYAGPPGGHTIMHLGAPLLAAAMPGSNRAVAHSTI